MRIIPLQTEKGYPLFLCQFLNWSGANDCINLAMVYNQRKKGSASFGKRVMRGHFGATELISIVAK